MKPELQKIFTKLSEEKLEKVELAIIDDVKARMKQISNLAKTADQVIKAASTVNNAIYKVENDAKYFKKYKSLVFQDMKAASNELYKEIQKLEASAKELGINIPEIKQAEGYRNIANDYLSTLDRVNLDFDI